MIDSYARQFETAAHDGVEAPDWLNGLRQGAIDGFRQTGFPSTKDEEWRFTSVAPIARGGFVASAKPGSLSLADLSPYLFGHPEWPRLVFVDGQYQLFQRDVEMSEDGYPPGETFMWTHSPMRITGTCSTMPLFGSIGRNGAP